MLWGWSRCGEYRTVADRIPIHSVHSLLDHSMVASQQWYGIAILWFQIIFCGESDSGKHDQNMESFHTWPQFTLNV